MARSKGVICSPTRNEQTLCRVAAGYPKGSPSRTNDTIRTPPARKERVEKGERAMNGRESNRNGLSRASRRLRAGRMLLLALGVVVATAVGAGARDLCAGCGNGGTFVLKGVKIPHQEQVRS